MRKFLNIYRDYFKIISIKDKNLIIFFIGNLIEIVVLLLIPYISSKILDFIINEVYNKALNFVFILLLFYAIKNILRYLNYYNYASYFKNCYIKLHTRLLNNIYNLNEDYSKKISDGKILNSCNMDIVNISELPSFLFEIILQLIKLVVILFIFYKYNFYIGLYSMAVMGFYCYFSFYCSIKNALYFMKQRQSADKLSNLLGQVLSGLKDIKSYNLKEKLNEKFDIERKNWGSNYFKKRKCFMYKNTLVLFFMETAKIVLYIVLILSIIKGKIAVSMLILLISYFENLGECSRTIASNYMSIMEESISFYRILDILNYDGNKITFGNQNIDLVKGKLELKNISFKLTDDFSLSNISFEVNQNELTAIVGPLGSGKTTIFNLILRLYESSKGKILLDDINILGYAKDIYSSNVTVVNQKSFLFNMSIKDNLSLIEKSFKKQVEVCKKVGIHNFIMSLKDGYNTIIENDGKNISGGQKQLLSLARALLTNTKVILFDEITSSLDPKTTNEVIKLLHQLKKEHTILVITHNKDLMRKADKIIVLNKGKVVCIGKHSALIKKNNLYKKLYQYGTQPN